MKWLAVERIAVILTVNHPYRPTLPDYHLESSPQLMVDNTDSGKGNINVPILTLGQLQGTSQMLGGGTSRAMEER